MDLATALATSSEAGIEFLKTELNLAHTFLDAAETTRSSEHRLSSHCDAEKAYRSVVKYLPRLRLSLEQALEFNERIAQLEERMTLAGIVL